MEKELSKEIREKLANFLETHPPDIFTISLRKMVLEYIRKNLRVGFAMDFDELLWALEDLFELLDTAGEERAEEESEVRGKRAGARGVDALRSQIGDKSERNRAGARGRPTPISDWR